MRRQFRSRDSRSENLVPILHNRQVSAAIMRLAEGLP